MARYWVKSFFANRLDLAGRKGFEPTTCRLLGSDCFGMGRDQWRLILVCRPTAATEFGLTSGPFIDALRGQWTTPKGDPRRRQQIANQPNRPRRPSTGRWGYSATCSTGQSAASTLNRTPFRRGTEVLIRMELEDNKRRRRVSESEEAALLAVAHRTCGR